MAEPIAIIITPSDETLVMVDATTQPTPDTDNRRRKVSQAGVFDQIKDVDTGLWHTLIVKDGQVVCGPGEP